MLAIPAHAQQYIRCCFIQVIFYLPSTIPITTLVYYSVSDNGDLKSKSLGVRNWWYVCVADLRAAENNANDCSSSTMTAKTNKQTNKNQRSSKDNRKLCIMT